MERLVLVKKHAYHDSVTLMAVSARVLDLPGVQQVQVAMGTDHNKELLAGVGLLTPEAEAAGPNDLLVAVGGDDRNACEAAVAQAEELLRKRTATGGGAAEPAPKTIAAAVKRQPEANLALISVPGQYAAREARQALENGLHVMLFSDNVSIGEEVALKLYAREKGLLLMGPDCGTAILGGTALAFANVVRRGRVGIVGASGTGTQEVTVLLDRLGVGISQAIGTGGRDLKAQVGGIMMIEGIKALGADPGTEVIVLISKPPANEVARRVLGALKAVGKPSVVCFLGSSPEVVEGTGALHAATLTEAAVKAAALARAGAQAAELPAADESLTFNLPQIEAPRFAPSQQHIRGLFCGGTLCHEAELIIGPGHTFIDFGDDQYTAGRPHPMIDPSLRNERIRREAADPATAVILLDVVLGYGSHSDPAGVLAPIVREARAGREILFIASVCGTDRDPQPRFAQVATLEAAGVVVAPSNAAAARLAASVLGGKGRG